MSNQSIAIGEEWDFNVNDVTRPKDPLRVLGEFLIQRSKELEGT